MGAAVLISSGIARIVMYVLCVTHGQRGGDARLFGCCFARGLHCARGSICFPDLTCSCVGGVCGHTAAVVRDAALAVAWRELRDPRGVPKRDVSLRCQPPAPYRLRRVRRYLSRAVAASSSRAGFVRVGVLDCPARALGLW